MKKIFSILHKNKSFIDEDLSESDVLPCSFSPIILIGKKEVIYFLNSSTKFKFNLGSIISLFAGTEKVKNLTIKGFKYKLMDSEFARDNPLGLSNEVIEDVQFVEFTKGVLVVIENKP